MLTFCCVCGPAAAGPSPPGRIYLAEIRKGRLCIGVHTHKLGIRRSFCVAVVVECLSTKSNK